MTDKLLIDRAVVQQALKCLETPIHEQPLGMRTQTASAFRAALEQPEPAQEPSYERGFIDGMLRAQERATPVKPAPAGLVGVVPITTVSSVTSVPTQPYRVLTDADLDAIRKIVREGEEK